MPQLTPLSLAARESETWLRQFARPAIWPLPLRFTLGYSRGTLPLTLSINIKKKNYLKNEKDKLRRTTPQTMALLTFHAGTALNLNRVADRSGRK